jgi:hypothetical protein
MAARADRRAAHKDIEDPQPQGAPLPTAPDHTHAQDRRDTERSAADEAEQEQERQLADGTESPG